MWTLVDPFHKIVHHHHWIEGPCIILALLLIMLAFLTMVQHRRGLKVWLHGAQQPKHTLPRLLEVYRI